MSLRAIAPWRQVAPRYAAEDGALALKRSDLRALIGLVALPAVLLSLPAAAGYPLMTGDALIQNYPLRVLAGAALVHGHLPTYDPFIFGGAPLLGGINAGAAFPDVILFGLLPHLAAWVVVEVIAYGGAACGLYLFLRANRLPPVAALLGGTTFGLGGFLSSQAVHLDVVETGAALAWALLALERLAHAPARQRAGWAALLAAAAGCAALAGSPEVAFDAALAAGVYAAHLLWRDGAPLRLSSWIVAGAAGGVLLGGLQITTGAQSVATSQRGQVDLQFLAAGTVDRGLVLLLAPDILGGGPIGLTPYVGSYNLAEIDAYTGIAALSAAAFLAACGRRPGASRWRVWYLVALVGLAVATCGDTGLVHLIAHVPVLDRSRLPSRALLLWSLSTAVLLAYFTSELVEPGSVTPEPGRGALAGHRLRQRFERRAARRPASRSGLATAAALLPPLLVITLIATLTLGGRRVAAWVAEQPVPGWSLTAVAPYLTCAAVLAAATALFLLVAPRLEPRARRRLLVALVVLDLALFSADQSSFAPVRAVAISAHGPLEAALAARLGSAGRFLVVDPQRSGGEALDEIGAPDLDLLDATPSAQGYGSLVWAPYQLATGTHGQDVVDPGALSGPTFDALDVRVLLVVGDDFLSPATSASSSGNAVWTLSGAAAGSRYFGRELAVRALSLSLAPRRGGAGGERLLVQAAASLRLLGSDGKIVGGQLQATAEPNGTIELRDPRPLEASGVLVRLPPGTGQLALRAVVEPAGGGPLAFDGALAEEVSLPHWRLAGSIGPYEVLADGRARGSYRFVTPAGDPAGASGAATARVLDSSRFTGALTLLVRTRRPVLLVRSVADIPGWTATLETAGQSRALPIERSGVEQEVLLPAGRDVVSFAYDAPGLEEGLVASSAGAALLLALVGNAWFARRRHRRRNPAGELAD